jgi:hypothetical protein
MIPGKVIVLLLAAFANATWADADTVDVTDRGPVDLTPFACTDITRSSLLNRVCYDEAKQVAVVEVRSTYRQFCDVPKATLDALLNAPSMGQFYNARIRGDASQGRYDCTRRTGSGYGPEDCRIVTLAICGSPSPKDAASQRGTTDAIPLK